MNPQVQGALRRLAATLRTGLHQRLAAVPEPKVFEAYAYFTAARVLSRVAGIKGRSLVARRLGPGGEFRFPGRPRHPASAGNSHLRAGPYELYAAIRFAGRSGVMHDVDVAVYAEEQVRELPRAEPPPGAAGLLWLACRLPGLRPGADTRTGREVAALKLEMRPQWPPGAVVLPGAVPPPLQRMAGAYGVVTHGRVDPVLGAAGPYTLERWIASELANSRFSW